jgi:hypothetical protein
VFLNLRKFSIRQWQLGVVLLFAVWYVLASTQLLFVIMDAVAPAVVVTQSASSCASKGCGCDVNDPDRVCCCTGKTAGASHGLPVDAKVLDLPITLSYLAASYCAGGFPEQDGLRPAPVLHLLAKAPPLLLTVLFLYFLPLSSSVYLSRKDDPPDKIPILSSHT